MKRTRASFTYRGISRLEARMIAARLEFNQIIIDRCKRFALESIGTHDYSKSNQPNKERIVQQITEGRIAEYAAFYAIPGCTPPDMNVYIAKSFRADLYCGELPIHVKAQSIDSAKRYGLSWTFQYGGISGRRDREVFDQTDLAYIVLTLVCHEAVFICGTPTLQLCQKHFKDPKLSYLKNEKKIIYYDDIKEDAWSLDIQVEKRNYSLL